MLYTYITHKQINWQGCMMKKIIYTLLIFVPTIFLSACGVTQASYYSRYSTIDYGNYNNDYVYSVGYYGYRPYWGNRFLSNVDVNLDEGYYPDRAWYGYVSRW